MKIFPVKKFSVLINVCSASTIFCLFLFHFYFDDDGACEILKFKCYFYLFVCFICGLTKFNMEI